MSSPPRPVAVVARFESGVSAELEDATAQQQQQRRLLSDATQRNKSALPGSRGEYYVKSGLVDMLAGGFASFFVALPVAAIDRAIVQNVAGTVPLGVGLREGFKKIVTHPIATVSHPSYLMVFGVYACTYVTANTFETVMYDVGVREPVMHQSAGKSFAVEPVVTVGEDVEARLRALQWSKFLGVTVANMAAAVSKDRAFARMYGTSAPSKLPMVSWACWITRDLLTIGAAFSLPKPLAKHLSTTDYTGGNGPLFSERQAAIAAQLLPVMMVQVVSTPLHLAANDFYNFKAGQPRVVDPVSGVLKSGAKTWQERWTLLRREGPKSFAARLCRIAPAFGFGGLGNTYVRDSLRLRLGLTV